MPSLLRLSLIALASLASFFLLLFAGGAVTGNSDVAVWVALPLGFIGTPALLLHLWRGPVPKQVTGDGFGTVRREPPDREDEIARFIAGFAGGSYVVIGLLVIAIYAVAKVSNGDLSDLFTAFMLKALIIAALYVLSLWLLATLRGKSTKRRAFSWACSVVFHVGLLAYLGVIEKIGDLIFVLCIPELLPALLSLAGLGLLIHGRLRPHAA